MLPRGGSVVYLGSETYLAASWLAGGALLLLAARRRRVEARVDHVLEPRRVDRGQRHVAEVLLVELVRPDHPEVEVDADLDHPLQGGDRVHAEPLTGMAFGLAHAEDEQVDVVLGDDRLDRVGEAERGRSLLAGGEGGLGDELRGGLLHFQRNPAAGLLGVHRDDLCAGQDRVGVVVVKGDFNVALGGDEELGLERGGVEQASALGAGGDLGGVQAGSAAEGEEDEEEFGFHAFPSGEG